MYAPIYRCLRTNICMYIHLIYNVCICMYRYVYKHIYWFIYTLYYVAAGAAGTSGRLSWRVGFQIDTRREL